MNKQMLSYIALPVIGLGLFGAQSASAHGMGMMGGFWSSNPEEIAIRQQTMFDEQAQIFGLTVDEVKNAWAEGKSLKELANAKGVTDEQIQARLKERQTQKLKTQFKTLVDRGIVPQSQADKRLAVMQNRLNHRKQMKRFHHGWMF